MKRTIRKLTALALVLTMVLSMSALAAKETPSKGFRLPGVKPRPTAVPEAPEATAAPEASAEPEATAAPEATATPEVTDTPVEEAVIATAYVALKDASSSLNVRAAASAQAERVGSLPNGDEVSVLGHENGWTKIRFGGGVGYVLSSYLTNEAPVVNPTEAPTEEPTAEPTEAPAEEPTVEATEAPAEEPTVEPTEAPAEEPTVEPTEAPAEEPTAAPDLTGLRQIIVVLRQGETSLKLYAEANENSEVLASVAAGEILYVQNIEAEWSYAVYGETAGYVRTDKIALFNESATPEEEEIIRTVNVSSNVADEETVYAGTEIVLTAKLTGFDDVQYSLQWQYTPDGGASVIDIPGADDMRYAFTIDESNAHYLWRVSVTILDEAATAAE